MHIYYLHTENAIQAVDAIAKGLSNLRLSTDLYLSDHEYALINNELILDEDNKLTAADLKNIVKKIGRIYRCSDSEIDPLEDRSAGYYKLVPTAETPLLEVSGVKMHISKSTDPFTSASEMSLQAVRTGDKVLDYCSGLGYAAIAVHCLAASEVTTIELSPEVMNLRALNSWS